MVVDCGSAMTFTAGDERGKLAGGAILPGVRLQLAALGTSTAQLPCGIVLPAELPPRSVVPWSVVPWSAFPLYMI